MLAAYLASFNPASDQDQTPDSGRKELLVYLIPEITSLVESYSKGPTLLYRPVILTAPLPNMAVSTAATDSKNETMHRSLDSTDSYVVRIGWCAIQYRANFRELWKKVAIAAIGDTCYEAIPIFTTEDQLATYLFLRGGLQPQPPNGALQGEPILHSLGNSFMYEAKEIRLTEVPNAQWGRVNSHAITGHGYGRYNSDLQGRYGTGALVYYRHRGDLRSYVDPSHKYSEWHEERQKAGCHFNKSSEEGEDQFACVCDLCEMEIHHYCRENYDDSCIFLCQCLCECQGCILRKTYEPCLGDDCGNSPDGLCKCTCTNCSIVCGVCYHCDGPNCWANQLADVRKESDYPVPNEQPSA